MTTNIFNSLNTFRSTVVFKLWLFQSNERCGYDPLSEKEKLVTENCVDKACILICRQATCDIAAGTACNTVSMWEQKWLATQATSIKWKVWVWFFIWKRKIGHRKLRAKSLRSHMPPSYLRHSCRYCMQYRFDVRTEVAGNSGLVSLNHQHACKVNLSLTSQACWQ